MAVTIDLSLHKQQSRALSCPAGEILFGGAAGGGKSHLLRAATITWAMKVPGIQIYLFRRTFPELVRNHLQGSGSYRVLLADAINHGVADIVGTEIRFNNGKPTERGDRWADGSRIFLRHLQHEKNIYDYQGAEIHVLIFDEATHFREAEYRYLRGRCRVVGLEIPDNCPWKFPKILMGSNPGGVGHQWVKASFVDAGGYVLHRAPKAEGGMVRCFVPSRIEDNPTLLEDDPDYMDRLEGLGDPALVKALKDGDWDVVAGAMYGDVWRSTIHLTDPFAIPADWDIWIGADDGFSAPAAAYFLTQDPSTGVVYVIGEVYKSGMYPDDYAAELREEASRIQIQEVHAGQTIERAWDEKADGGITGMMDSGAFANTGQKEISRGDQMKGLGIRIRPVDKWPGSPRDRAINLHRMLAWKADDDGRILQPPQLRVFKGCAPHLCRTLPALPRDARDPDRVDTDAEDHAFDGLTYGLQWKPNLIKRTRISGT